MGKDEAGAFSLRNTTTCQDTVLLARHGAGSVCALTCFCEPGGGRVGVDGAEPDHLVEFGAFTDRHADEGIGLLWDDQHLKDLQWAWQREVDVLGRGRGSR